MVTAPATTASELVLGSTGQYGHEVLDSHVGIRVEAATLSLRVDRCTQPAVVIAGGGPTGMMLAGELALAGVDAVVVERRSNQELDDRAPEVFTPEPSRCSMTMGSRVGSR